MFFFKPHVCFFFFFTAGAIFGLKCGCDWLGWLVFLLCFCLFPTTAICVCVTTDAGSRRKTGPVCVFGYADTGTEIQLGSKRQNPSQTMKLGARDHSRPTKKKHTPRLDLSFLLSLFPPQYGDQAQQKVLSLTEGLVRATLLSLNLSSSAPPGWQGLHRSHRAFTASFCTKGKTCKQTQQARQDRRTNTSRRPTHVRGVPALTQCTLQLRCSSRRRAAAA